jgi:hypothetical protein
LEGPGEADGTEIKWTNQLLVYVDVILLEDKEKHRNSN